MKIGEQENVSESRLLQTIFVIASSNLTDYYDDQTSLDDLPTKVDDQTSLYDVPAKVDSPHYRKNLSWLMKFSAMQATAYSPANLISDLARVSRRESLTIDNYCDVIHKAIEDWDTEQLSEMMFVLPFSMHASHYEDFKRILSRLDKSTEQLLEEQTRQYLWRKLPRANLEPTAEAIMEHEASGSMDVDLLKGLIRELVHKVPWENHGWFDNEWVKSNSLWENSAPEFLRLCDLAQDYLFGRYFGWPSADSFYLKADSVLRKQMAEATSAAPPFTEKQIEACFNIVAEQIQARKVPPSRSATSKKSYEAPARHDRIKPKEVPVEPEVERSKGRQRILRILNSVVGRRATGTRENGMSPKAHARAKSHN